MAQGAMILVDSAAAPVQALQAWSAAILAIASGVLLLVGLVTPGAGILVLMGSVLLAQPWLPALTPDPRPDPLIALLVGVMSLAIVSLGPGAFSVDARLFGRREIVIPADASRRGPGL